MEGTVTYFALLTLSFSFVNTNSVKFYEAKNSHTALDLSDQEVQSLAGLSNENHLQDILKEILVPRVVGTKNHERVGNFISKEMKDLKWDVTEDTFTDRTPMGNLKFRNIIAKLNPNADRFLVLACHYDSKYSRENDFIGATDSAVPCAMMMNLAKVMAPLLNKLKSQDDLSLMLIFFDGEEAFRYWSATDSIYGARHLAQTWENTPYKDGANHLQRIDVLVLLDLLGTPDPVFHSFFQNTEKWYVRLASAEQRLAELNQFKGYSRGSSEQTYFRLRSSGSFIEDDHIPFLRRNVPILHMIPSPFPSVWHTPNDNYSALDFNTIENLNKIFRVFVAEYLRVKP